MANTFGDLLISLASHMAYMQGQLEASRALEDPEDYYWYRESVLLRQKVTDALADKPAVSAPTVMEIVELSSEIEAAGLGQVDFARAVLARWGNSAPQPPADGEVAELVAWLREQAEHELGSTFDADYFSEDPAARNLNRAADLLQRLSPPQPVPVSERLPEARDCDAQGRCWWWSAETIERVGCWMLSRGTGAEMCWLPAHALPLPEVGE